MDASEAARLNRRYWDAISADYQAQNARDLEDDLRWGPSMPSEETLCVLGAHGVAGKDVLELGCGGGQGAVWAAKRGARRVVGVDVSVKQLDHARRLAASRGVAVEWREGDVADLGFLAAASMDVVFSAFALGYVLDVARVFREAFRVLRPGGLLAFSWSSPVFERTTLLPGGALMVTRPWWDSAPVVERDEHGSSVEAVRTYGEWLAALVAAGFVVTDILEPRSVGASTWTTHPVEKLALVPGTTILRALKQPVSR